MQSSRPIERSSDKRATCAKLIFFKAVDGKMAEYSDYLRASVEPIDHQAIREGALLDEMTMVADANASLPWTHLRIFLFEDTAQRSAVKSAFARIAPTLEPDTSRRAARKAYGENLRVLVSESDVELLG